MLIAGKKIIKHYEETMSFKKLFESNRSLTQIWKSNPSTNNKSKSHTRHHVQKKQNRTTATADDLVLALDLFTQITEKKFFQSPK